MYLQGMCAEVSGGQGGSLIKKLPYFLSMLA